MIEKEGNEGSKAKQYLIFSVKLHLKWNLWWWLFFLFFLWQGKTKSTPCHGRGSEIENKGKKKILKMYLTKRLTVQLVISLTSRRVWWIHLKVMLILLIVVSTLDRIAFRIWKFSPVLMMIRMIPRLSHPHQGWHLDPCLKSFLHLSLVLWHFKIQCFYENYCSNNSKY